MPWNLAHSLLGNEMIVRCAYEISQVISNLCAFYQREVVGRSMPAHTREDEELQSEMITEQRFSQQFRVRIMQGVGLEASVPGAVTHRVRARELSSV